MTKDPHLTLPLEAAWLIDRADVQNEQGSKWMLRPIMLTFNGFHTPQVRGQSGYEQFKKSHTLRVPWNGRACSVKWQNNAVPSALRTPIAS